MIIGQVTFDYHRKGTPCSTLIVLLFWGLETLTPAYPFFTLFFFLALELQLLCQQKGISYICFSFSNSSVLLFFPSTLLPSVNGGGLSQFRSL